MNYCSLSDKIYKRMKETTKGTIYVNNDFYDLGNIDSIRKALSRLCVKNKIYRLIEGYYTIPYFIEIVHEYSYPTTDELAEKIAEKYAWNISSFGESALNQVGLSTQVPTVCEYLSDGPYREYVYLNKTIKFKHTSNRSISKYSKPVSLLIQSIKAVGKSHITEKDIRIMSNFKKKYISEDLLRETKSVPVWIYEIIRKLSEVD